jgi:hypothetical protein
MCESIFIPVLAPVLVLLPPLPPPRLRVRDDAQIQWRICANRSQWGLGLSVTSYMQSAREELRLPHIYRASVVDQK